MLDFYFDIDRESDENDVDKNINEITENKDNDNELSDNNDNYEKIDKKIN